MNKLIDLEKENKYLFHGSGNLIEEFEPRQAHTVVDDKRIPDGEPAVFASPFANYAVFKAILNKSNCLRGFTASCAYSRGELKFTATQETLDQLNENSRGYVYVFNRTDFHKRNSSEWVSNTKVKPIDRIEVKWSDFNARYTTVY